MGARFEPDDDLKSLAESLGCDPAELTDEPRGAMPGAGPADDQRPAEAGGVPPGGLAQGDAREPAVEVERTEVLAPAPEEVPLEPEDGNRIINDGQPPAPSIDPKHGGLTHKQRAALDYKLAHFEATDRQVGRAVGLNQANVSALMKKPQAKLYMSTYLDRAGATLEAAAVVIAEAHKATKKQPITWEGVVTDTFEQPDHERRLTAARMSMEAHGVLDEKGVQVNLYAQLSDEQLAAIASGVARAEDFIEGQVAR